MFAVLPIAFAGCYDRTCNFELKWTIIDPPDGDFWESSTLEGEWLDFSGGRGWMFDTQHVQGRRIVATYAFISPGKQPGKQPPDEPTDNYTVASGNLAEFELPCVPPATRLADGTCNGTPSVFVKNATCADYFLRVVIQFAPRTSPPAGDAGADAGVFAPIDASID